MYRYFQKHQRSVLGVIVGGFIILAMLPFGTNFEDTARRDYAMKINNEAIGFQEFRTRREMLVENVRSMFGDQIQQIYPKFFEELDSNVAESMIDDTVLRQFAQHLGLAAGEMELQKIIRTRYLPPGSTAETALARVRQLGYANVAEFEKALSNEILVQELSGILQDFSELSDQEIKEIMREQGRTFDVEHVTVDLASLREGLPEPDEDALKAYYESRAAEYEQEPRVAYEALPYLPGAFSQHVELQPEDIEVAYSERQQDFRIPDEARLEMLELRLSSKASEKEKEAVQQEALRLHEKARAGESLAKLEKEIGKKLSVTASYSAPVLVQRGQKGSEFDTAVFSSTAIGVLDLIAVPGAYIIASLSERLQNRIKSLADVKDQIELELRAQEAPGYALVAGQTDFDEWQKSGKSLAQFGEEKKVATSVVSQKTLSQKGSDPEGFHGLTAKVLESVNGEGAFFVEQGDRVYLVEVTAYRPREIPALAEVSEKVKEDFLKEDALALARKELKNYVKNSEADKALGKMVIGSKTFEAKQENGLSLNNPQGVLFEDERMYEELARVQQGNLLLADVMEGKESLSAVRIVAVHYPKAEELDKKLASQRRVVQRAAAQELRAALLATQKANSEIEVKDWLTKS